MLLGYARVSTGDQDLTIQREALEAAGCERIRHEKASGKSQNGRPELENLLDFIRDGDILVVTRLDRLARSVFDLQDIATKLREKGVSLRVLQQPVDTTTSAGRMFYTMLGAFAEFELDIRRERQMEGIAKAKAAGKYKGRKPTARVKLPDIKKLAESGKPKAAIARELGISRASVHRLLAESVL